VTTGGPPLVEVRGLAKTYGNIRALRGVGVSFRRGEVHGLIGANGAGKSTLIRCLAGLEQPDGGEVLLGGEPRTIHDPAAAAKLGLAFIHQELNLVSTFTGAQNILLGSHSGGMLKPRRFGGVPHRVREAARRIGIDFDLDVPVGTLSVHQQWLVTIARALLEDRDLVAMDEPTASLDADEAATLLRVTRQLADAGVAVIFISHRLDEVTEVCDRVTAFRDGAVSLSLPKQDLTRESLVRAIVGHEVVPRSGTQADAEVPDRPVLLDIKDLTRGRAVRGASFTLYQGEMLGIAGLVGSGRTELARTIFGADRSDSGAMTMDGKAYAPKSVADAIRNGLAYVPEERRSQALFLTHSIADNLHVTRWERLRVGRWLPLIRPGAARAAAQEVCARLGVKVASSDTGKAVQTLSGGNQQKVVMGRWLVTAPKILILDEPTRGVDIGARADIYGRIREVAAKGTTVIVISSEFEELLECGRVLVMAQGRIVGQLSGADVSVPNMLNLCYA
jgi:ABC-type sugar transport system ATPase subunit